MIKTIHQYTTDVTPGDGVSNSLFHIQTLLEEMGISSDIFADKIHPDLKEMVRPWKDYPDTGEDLLLLHHSVAQLHPGWIETLKDIRAMVYHNITPSHYFKTGTAHHRVTRQGRRDLQQWPPLFKGVIADSTYNADELAFLGYENIHEIPLVVDIEKMRTSRGNWGNLSLAHEKTFNLLFVGRIVENKCQHDLIQALAEINDDSVHLFCVGGVSIPSYQHYLETLADALGLQNRVHLTGRVSDEDLAGYYRTADLFVCLSDHEGFGIPLIEAAAAGLPVVAYDSSNIKHTLDGKGVLLNGKNSRDAARAWARLINNPLWRHRLAAAQKDGLDRFERALLKRKLAAFLHSFIPDQPIVLANDFLAANKKAPDSKLRISIEGPFDSNYSLALVNRELARAFARANHGVVLHSTEGEGDYTPDPAYLNDCPDIKAMWNGGIQGKSAGMAIRNLYPPRVTRMNGSITVLGPYGWEESAFPKEWITEFNRRLILVTAMSGYVARTLENNGLTVPTAVVGIGADHLKEVSPKPLPFQTPKGFTLLHISSCFPRKGVDLVLAAFEQAFPGNRPATLVIKTFPNPHNDVRRQLDRTGWTLEAPPFGFGRKGDTKKVILVETEMTPGQMVSLYTGADALAAPSRGEGFGLPMAEAMLFNLPVITTGYGGQTDFCTPDTAWLIDYEFARAKTHMNLEDSVWVEPDMDDLAAKIRQVAALPRHRIKQKTDEARKLILDHHTWDRVADRMLKAVDRLDRLPAHRPARTLGWVSTWNTACGIASYSRYLVTALMEAQQADGLETGRTVILANRTGQTTKIDEPNVIRCWQEGGEDDLEALMQTVRSQRIKDLVIQFNFSFFGLNALARLLDSMKKEGINCHLFFHSTADVLPPHEPKSLSWIRASLSGAVRLYVHSVPDLNQLKAFGLVDNVVLFPHGIIQETSAVPPRTPDTDLIAAFGFLLPHKGIRELISAFEILKAQRPGAKLLLLTAVYPVPVSENEKRLCIERIEACPWKNDITMVNDYLDDSEIKKRLSRATVIVFPCQETQESSSASVRMGLSAGRPVAVTPLDIFDDVRQAVFTLPGQTPQDIARGLEAFMADDAGLEKAAARQQAFIESHAWPVVGRQLNRILTGLGAHAV